MTTASQEKIDEIAFFFNSSVSPHNFAHFCMDLLPQIAFFHYIRSLGINVLPVISEQFKYPIMSVLFKHLVAEKYMVLKANKSYVFDDMLVPKALNSFFAKDAYPEFTKAALNYVQTDIRQTFDLDKHLPDKKIFVTRKDGTTENQGFLRQYRNQSELEILMQENGFTFVTVSNYKPRELIHLFAQAKVVVGVHGAGLLNVIFSNQSVSVIELSVPNRPLTPPCNERFIKAYGMAYEQIPVVTEDSASIDLTKLQDAVDKTI